MLLKDLIQIPESVGAQDFVLKLTEGVTAEAARRTLDDYVLTPNLAKRFDEALGLVKATLGLSEGPDGKVHQGPHQKGRAIYLHGSFGSGKSHFMAVLHRLLVGDRDALARPELSAVVAKHGSWLGTKKFLLVPYHMLGARSLEERVFDGYCRVVRHAHPDAKLPALFNTDAVIRDAEALRLKLGDETFLRLVADDSADAGWGDFGGGSWTLERYLTAMQAPHGSEERQAVATVLIERVFANQADRGGTVEFAAGLETMTRHAQSLGYDAIVLFLDELILWLASHASTPGFIETQADKLVNLVESDRLQRPIPLVSFIARQRDLRDLVQRNTPGAAQLDIDDKLSHHEGRFTEIKLETTDLPEIASKRLLKARNEGARSSIDAAFQHLTAGRDDLRQALLGDRYTVGDFRKVYPFSPVLVDALVQASSMLQRDRTALRAMLLLLVERRDTLDAGEIIPVGDLYDVISRGNEAVTGAFKEAFERARRLYEEKLLPLLEDEHGMPRYEIEQLDWDDERRSKWRTDDRILKTLLLSTLVSGVPVLENLDAKRIALLNHGSITTRIPGQEGATVLRKLRSWGNRVAEIRITGDAQNPRIALELHGVDVEGVIRNALDYDNHGNRIGLVKQILCERFALKDPTGDAAFDVEWRGTRRRAQVLIGNLATLPLASLDNDSSDWKVVVDYPFDDQADGAVRDQRKVDEFRKTGRQARTVVWAPLFLNHLGREELGRLVVIDRVLRSDQTFEQYSQHLSAADRVQAKSLLRGQWETLKHSIEGYLLAAYGLSNDSAYTKALDMGVVVPERLISLEPSLELRPPGTGNLEQGLRALVEQALEFQYPAAPNWPRTFTRAQLGRCLEIALDAAGSETWRATLDTLDLRLMRDFAGPLKLGETESAFVLRDLWKKELDAKIRQSGAPRAAVGDLRRWTDEPQPRGLPREVLDLLVIVYAAMSERALFRDGQALTETKLGDLRPEDELRPIPLPDKEAWGKACQVAGGVFGVAADLYLTGANVASLARRIQKEATEATRAAQDLYKALSKTPQTRMALDSVRLADARSTLELFESLDGREAKEVVEVLASVEFPAAVTNESVARSWRQARKVADALGEMNWTLLDIVENLKDDANFAKGARELLAEIQDALAHSELVVPLAPMLKSGERKATELIEASQKRSKPPTGKLEKAVVRSSGDVDQVSQRLREALKRAPGIEVTWIVPGEDEP